MTDRPRRDAGLSPDAMRDVALRYVAAVNATDAEAVLALFAPGDDVSVEDPVGAPVHRGRPALERFYREGLPAARPRLTLAGPVCTTRAGEVVVPFRMRVDTARGPREADVTDVLRLDADGRIVSLRAFWDARELREPASEGV